MKSLVVGIGNPLAGADGFGPAVIAALRRSATLPESIELIDAHTDLLAIIDQFPSFGHVILVDAVLGEGHRRVGVFDESTFSQWNAASPSGHEISALLAVGLFRRLYPEAVTRISLVALDVSEIAVDRPFPTGKVDEAVLSILQLLAA